jgi:hypothetical protein
LTYTFSIATNIKGQREYIAMRHIAVTYVHKRTIRNGQGKIIKYET